ncbi:crAss001_48 related protein [Pseudomonas sp. NA-150]|uniref:crAss001_48 related protein n=1 Tax=Pseudomonas sp. NA-150 TaxID=3367525 RepID=UPI0037CC7B12
MTQEYIGTKQVTAWPELKDAIEGFAVKYEDGYTSWSPKDVFEKAYIGIGQVKQHPPHVQRMIGEKAQNDDRLVKLKEFIETPGFRELSSKSQELLTTQVGAMGELSGILAERIAL